MDAEELRPYLARFVTVTLDDGTEISGYIANPEDFRKDNAKADQIRLVNGLQNSITEISRIIDIKVVNRQDTTEIPVIGESSDVVSRMKKKQSQDFDEKLDELFDKSLSDTLEVKLPNGKIIHSHSEDE
ncbi:MAG: hypothetical protein LKE64_00570 [Solobacterium sp.]|jgi:hypothetical protein|nr:hypothetical protein [Solobacterium sp.]MCH4050068.1 hypothetical protein [Solobacterium sp.]MCH4073753.1 hypothetical protein [Solobacterium sp.]MCI1313862.1 hypothetical protein [Solobacterium sp.]MCI1346541.1 hypothetical protein [Solobacterium sp.]